MITPPQLTQFLQDLSQFCSKDLDINELKTSQKNNSSPITQLDIEISNFCKRHPYCSGNFFSEEDHGELSFPTIVLDPIDGTKELIKMNGECSVSIAWMSSPISGEALIFNPFTGFNFTSFDRSAWDLRTVERPYLGLVSRSEFNHFKQTPYTLVARGSIAFKLGLLASGGSDFVVSLKPKSIWDIAAGTLLAWQRGMKFYSNGQLVTELSEVEYHPPLLWSKKQIAEELNSYFSSHEDISR